MPPGAKLMPWRRPWPIRAAGARLGQALRNRAIERFTWDHAAVQIESVYEGLLASISLHSHDVL